MDSCNFSVDIENLAQKRKMFLICSSIEAELTIESISEVFEESGKSTIYQVEFGKLSSV
jgi:hypothetical protein